MHVHVVGSTSIDAAFEIAKALSGPSDSLVLSVQALRGSARRFILVTANRPESLGGPLRNLLIAVKEMVSENEDLNIVLDGPSHPNVAPWFARFLGRSPISV